MNDQDFYRKIDVPSPRLGTEDRMVLRLAFRNERKLYHRKCDLCKKEIIAMYASGAPYTVYCQNCWWSDKWDAEQYGRDFDFSRPFFEQFNELMKAIPRIALMNKEAENSDYCNFAWRNKNCYLMFTSAENEDSFYSKRCWKMKNICDCSNLVSCELCYECTDCSKCYNCAYLQNSTDCSDCFVGFNLRSCKNCFGCNNLVQKSYCIYNVQYSKEEYETKVVELKKNLKEEFKKFLVGPIMRKNMYLLNTENSSGTALINCKNSTFCFDSSELQDCENIFDASNLKDCQDINNDDHSELCFHGVGGESNYMVRYFDICWWNKYLTYCSLCFHSSYLFGCVGLKKGEYQILNKKYSKEDYEDLMARIIEHMKKSKEWGEFFPSTVSPFGYNESVAQDHYPLAKEQAVKLGFNWREDSEQSLYQGPKVNVPENIEEVDESITKKILTCEVSGKSYKITPQELEFYKKMQLHLPKKCFEQRFTERLARKDPRHLWQRTCSSCSQPIESVYAPERPEKVLCEACYLKTVY